ncbi:MAG: extracellular solute-binding protein [Woeseiaceae bacterium]|nr:extracellular solute-binding protein [Woeseiaceae bacterium]
MTRQITTLVATSPIVAVFLSVLLSCTPDRTAELAGDEQVVNVFNWVDYIAPNTTERFESEFGIKVNYDVYDSAEVVDVKLLAGNSGYDVVVHSSQFASRLTPIGVYKRLDYSRLDNVRHIDPDFREKIDVYDRMLDYAIPYHWGSTGYAWNEELVRQRLPDHPMDSADVLFDPAVASKLADCGISLLDSPADLFPMVLAYLGRDPNAVDDESLAAGEAQLKSVRPYVRYFSNQKMLTDLPSREVCVAMSWSGDYAQAALRAEKAGLDIRLRYTMPKEGSALWVDGVYIPSDAPHVDNAYLFMNFLMRPDIAADIANTVFYANSNKTSQQYIDPRIINDPAIYPDKKDWHLLFRILNVDPKRERFRTRAFARVKAGI